MKLNNDRYPRVITRKGERLGSLSPHAAATLTADRAAFVQLMRHLKQADAGHTVIMVQVENDPARMAAHGITRRSRKRRSRGRFPQL